MLIEEIVGAEVDETKAAWARKGGKVVRKFRCTSGPRKGRVVSDPGQCFQPIDIQKRLTLRKTKSRKGAQMRRRAKRTKRFNPTSRRVRRLNK